MSISEKLIALNTIKAEIKQIIDDNGIDAGNIFETYPDKLRSLIDTLKNRNITVIDGSAIAPID